MKPNIEKLDGLPDEQLQTISKDIKEIGFRKAAAKASAETERDITKSDLQRFDARCVANEFLGDSPDASTACVEVLRFAATGRPDFSEGTIKVLEQTMFKLALVCTKSEAEMKALNLVTTMLCRFRSTSVRERMARVQEDKVRLRYFELQLKQQQIAEKKKAQSPDAQAQCDHLGYLAANLDDIEARATKHFNLPPLPNQEKGPATSESNNATPPANIISLPDTDQPVPGAAPRETAADIDHSNASTLSNAPLDFEKLDISPSEASPQPYRQNNKNSASAAAPRESAADVDPNDAPTAPNAPLDIETLDISHSDAPRRPYRQSEKNSHTPPSTESSSRGDETLKLQLAAPSSALPAPNSPADISASDIGPSGAARRPYRQTEKISTSVAASHETAANCPLSSQSETEISSPLEKTEPAAQNPSPSAKSKSSAVNNSCSPISVDSCPLVAKEHAIKRWRSFIPNDKTTTQPDESWRDECACGKPLPCADHPQLWLTIRYYRPQNISYKEALEDSGIPYYIPTPEELGCSEETLKQSINPFTNNPQIVDAPSPYAIPRPSPGTPAPCRLPHLTYS